MDWKDKYLNKITCCDCLPAMREIPDKAIDLILCDPPYGIGASSKKFINGTSKTIKDYYRDDCWDIKITKEYFIEIMRISKNQVIWGGNYYASILGDHRCYFVWDKTIHGNSYADCEIAWTSFDKPARYFRKNIADIEKRDKRCHPTQKPTSLFEWILDKYSEEGQLICDPFLGSGTTAIACQNLKRNYIGFELDEEYCRIAQERTKYIRQGLF